MDPLSELLDAYPARGNLDVRCQWSGNWVYPHPAEATGTVRFHVILQGKAFLRMDGVKPLALSAGDVVVLPAGEAHLLGSGPDDWHAPRPVANVREHPLLEWRASDAEAELDMLCGRIDFGESAATMLAALPRILHWPGPAGMPMETLAPLVALMRREVQQAAAGARSLVGQLSS